MYHLVNMMAKTEAAHIGSLLSSHTTLEAAEAAQARFNSKFEKGTYVLTTICDDNDGYYIDWGDVWRSHDQA